MTETVISFTPSQMWSWVLAVFGFLIAAGGAVAVLAKFIGWLKKPSTDLASRVSVLESTVKRHDEKLEHDNNRLKNGEEENKVMLRALLALLDHSLDGNNIDQMQAAKADLQKHLIER